MKDSLIKISGRVVQGRKFGRQIGFPTANLDRRDFSRQKLKIRFGVYSGEAELDFGKKFKAGIVIGPLDSKGLPKIEAYLIGFQGQLYGHKLILYLNKFLRPFRKFNSLEQLKARIREDVRHIKKS